MKKTGILLIYIFIFLISSAYAKEDKIRINGRLDLYCSSTFSLDEIKDEQSLQTSHGISFIIFPKEIPKAFTGCQNVWLGNGHKLITKHYSSGQITWIKGQEPKEVPPFFCLYKNGQLLIEKSFNLRRCEDSI